MPVLNLKNGIAPSGNVSSRSAHTLSIAGLTCEEVADTDLLEASLLAFVERIGWVPRIRI
mgnify:CR=1